MDVKIRRAEPEDIEGIYDLVKELAVYEKEPEAVTATLDDYYRDFADGYFDSHVAEYENQIIGMTVFYMTYSTWKGKMLYLEDFVIKSDFRQKGIGQLLFDAFIEEAKRQEARLVKWQVLHWNEPAIKFYEKNKALIEKEWYNGKLFLGEDLREKRN